VPFCKYTAKSKFGATNRNYALAFRSKFFLTRISRIYTNGYSPQRS